MTQLVQIKNLRDYTKCSNYAKYHWHYLDSSSESTCRSIIESCYRDIALHNKKVDWRTVRNRVYREVFRETNQNVDSLYKEALAVLSTLRNWYLEYYRDEPGEAILNVDLEEETNGMKVTARIDGVLINGDDVTLIYFTEEKEPQEILRDIGLRTRVYLLGREKILVNKILAINATDKTVTCNKLTVHNPIEWNYKTRQALGMILLSMKNNIYYPSVTSMCNSCPYKSVCSW